jgi:hypothetical protein
MNWIKGNERIPVLVFQFKQDPRLAKLMSSLYELLVAFQEAKEVLCSEIDRLSKRVRKSETQPR